MARQLGQRERRDGALGRRGAVDRGVVADHQLAVRRGVDVELDAGGARLQRVGDGVQGRGRRLPGPALMRVGDHPALEPHRRIAHRPDGNSRRAPTPAPGRAPVVGEAGGRRGGPILVRRARSSPRRPHRHHPFLLRPGAPAAPGGRGALPGRRLPGRRLLGDLLQPAGRGAAAPGAGRRLGRLAHLEPDLLPQLVHRRAAGRAARGRDRGGAARPAHGRGARHREGHDGPAGRRAAGRPGRPGAHRHHH